jgi:hypothetical protein
MKKILNKILVAIAFTVIAASCKKADLATNNPFVDVTNLGAGAYITFNSAINYNLNFAAIGASKVGIKVDAYNNGAKIKEIKLYVFKGSSADPKAWKFIKTVPYSGTTELSATGAEIATAYGTTTAALFSPGQFYTFYNQVITEDGKVFDLSNTLGALESSSNYNASFRWTAFVVCPFTGGMTGNYKVVQDDWQDWSPGDIVKVTDGPAANQINLSAVWPNPVYGNVVNPLVIKIDPATGAATLATNNVVFADYGQLTSAYIPAAGTLGYVFSCTGYVGLKIGVRYGTSDQGTLTLILQKQ